MRCHWRPCASVLRANYLIATTKGRLIVYTRALMISPSSSTATAPQLIAPGFTEEQGNAESCIQRGSPEVSRLIMARALIFRSYVWQTLGRPAVLLLHSGDPSRSRETL